MGAHRGTGANDGVLEGRISGRSSMWIRLAGSLAIVCVVSLVPDRATAQTEQPGVVPNQKHQAGALLGLGKNYPSPFSATTRIPFSVGDAPACTDGGRRYHVSLRIYNLLAQVVAVPVMAEGGTSIAPAGQPVQALDLPCGQYTAYWDGVGLVNNHEVAPGMYLYRLEVNGKAVGRKMLIQR
jgi:hypothetical protein